LLEEWRELDPSARGVMAWPPGHFYSPLLDLTQLGPGDEGSPHDGEEMWEHIPLRDAEQRSYFRHLLEKHPLFPYPEDKSSEYRYHTVNHFFPPSDAFTLSAVLRNERPQRVIEVGSGYSSAVMLDTVQYGGLSARLTFIEPYPDRLYSLLSDEDKKSTEIVVKNVQTVDITIFDQLEAGDVLFIDSSHVAKVGSDVSVLYLRVLPRLKPGVIVHVHDVFYPDSYPSPWLKDGWAWNESLFLRAVLIGNPQFQVLAFNSYAARVFPELFMEKMPSFVRSAGGSMWLRKVA
jgi:predicted O-methyltransferase YrrM